MKKIILFVILLVASNVMYSQTLVGYSYNELFSHISDNYEIKRDDKGNPVYVGAVNSSGDMQLYYINSDLKVYQSVMCPNSSSKANEYIQRFDADCIKLYDNYWIYQPHKQLCHLVRATDGSLYFVWTELTVTNREITFSMIGKTYKQLTEVLSEDDIKIEYHKNSQNIFIVTSHSGYGDVIKYYFEQYTGFIYAMILIPKNSIELENYKKQYDKDYMKTYNNKWVDKGKLEIGELYNDEKYNTKYFIWRAL